MTCLISMPESREYNLTKPDSAENFDKAGERYSVNLGLGGSTRFAFLRSSSRKKTMCPHHYPWRCLTYYLKYGSVRTVPTYQARKVYKMYFLL